jgi:hypothetical protein
VQFATQNKAPHLTIINVWRLLIRKWV